MTHSPLLTLAEVAGIALHWQDYKGRQHRVTDEVLRGLLGALGLPAAHDAQCAATLNRERQAEQSHAWPSLLIGSVHEPLALPPAAQGLGRVELILESGVTQHLALQRDELGRSCLPGIAEPGYHRLLLPQGQTVTFAIAPKTAWPVRRKANGSKCYGLGAQVYSLRHPGDVGIGDGGGVRALLAGAARAGADALAISPMHALFAADPDRHAPYSPSSRLFLNPLHAHPATVLGDAALRSAIAETGLGEIGARLEAEPLIDYGSAARAKWQLLRTLWQQWRERLRAGQSPHAERFQNFVRQGGSALAAHACFESLQCAHVEALGRDWRHWPADLQGPTASGALVHAREHVDDIAFHQFAQWLARECLAASQRTARQAGMAIGLITDLAVGTDAAGSHAWSRPGELLAGVSIGAPPDPLAPEGQDWGLTTFSPRSLQAQGYAPFIELLRASLRDAGGVRIDHVLGLGRLWLAPHGAAAGQGAYLSYPLADLLRLVALESHRHQAIVIGEDLGTLPEQFRQSLSEAGVQGLRVLYFEREHKLFVAPKRWSENAVATTSTHDLPPLAGWWRGQDLKLRAGLGLLTEAELALAQDEREESRRCLLSALTHEGLMPEVGPSQADVPTLVTAACRFVAASPAPLALLPLEDALGLTEMPNLPGTVDSHPNWRRRLPGRADALLDDALVQARLGAVREARGSGPE